MQTPFASKRIALTGGIASGKSLAGNYLRQRSVPVIDADDVVHELLRDDEALKESIRNTFSPEVFTAEGLVNRPALGQLIFADPSKRKLLESWIHPKTRTCIENFQQTHSNCPLTIAIIPLLFESKLEDRYDEVWLLDTSEALQMVRLLQNRGMTAADAEARIRNQMSADDKRKRAELHPCHRILHNTGDPDALYRELDEALTLAGWW